MNGFTLSSLLLAAAELEGQAPLLLITGLLGGFTTFMAAFWLCRR